MPSIIEAIHVCDSGPCRNDDLRASAFCKRVFPKSLLPWREKVRMRGSLSLPQPERGDDIEVPAVLKGVPEVVPGGGPDHCAVVGAEAGARNDDGHG